MSIEHDSDLPPLQYTDPPAIPIESLVAVATVTLTASDVPPRILRDFYTRILGLVLLDADKETFRFAQNTRRIVLDRNHPIPGRLGLLIRDFPNALLQLRDNQIPFELSHIDGGLSRSAILRDPAGNWIHLLETRTF